MGGLSWRPARWRSECGSGRAAGGGRGQPAPPGPAGGEASPPGQGPAAVCPVSRGLRGSCRGVPSPRCRPLRSAPPRSARRWGGGLRGCARAEYPGQPDGLCLRRRREPPARGRGGSAPERPCAAGRALANAARAGAVGLAPRVRYTRRAQWAGSFCPRQLFPRIPSCGAARLQRAEDLRNNQPQESELPVSVCEQTPLLKATATS